MGLTRPGRYGGCSKTVSASVPFTIITFVVLYRKGLCIVKASAVTKKAHTMQRNSFGSRVKKDLRRNGSLYLLVLPLVTFYILFTYKPMYGILIAFKDYVPSTGIWNSEWVGFKYFREFFENPYFLRLITNTLRISITSLLVCFPAPIILALMMNELRGKAFPRVVQTVSYLPHFISTIVICGLVIKYTSASGFIGQLVAMLTGNEAVSLLNYEQYFVPIYVLSDLWQGVGWGSIIYLAALTNVDQELYEASTIDGAGRFQQTIHITLPGIAPTVVLMLILAIGGIMSVGYEKIINLYNGAILNTADVISTYVYRKGILETNYSYSTAVGLFSSVISLILVFSAQWFSKKVTDSSLY